MDFGVEAQRDLAAVGPIRRFTAFYAEGEIVIDAFPECGLDLRKGFAIERDDISQADNLPHEGPVICFDGSGVTFVFQLDSIPSRSEPGHNTFF